MRKLVGNPQVRFVRRKNKQNIFRKTFSNFKLIVEIYSAFTSWEKNRINTSKMCLPGAQYAPTVVRISFQLHECHDDEGRRGGLFIIM
jgi:hypothetical protein